MERKSLIRKLVFSSAGAIVIAFAGIQFYQHRHHKEAVVINENVEVKRRTGIVATNLLQEWLKND